MNSRTRPPEPRFRVLVGTDSRHLLDRPEPHPDWPDTCRFLPLGHRDSATLWYRALRQEAVYQDAVFCLFPDTAAPAWTADWHEQARYWAAAWSRRPFVVRCLAGVSLVEAAALAWQTHRQTTCSADALLGNRGRTSPVHWQWHWFRTWSAQDPRNHRRGMGRHHLVRTIMGHTGHRWPVRVCDPCGSTRLTWDPDALAHAVSAMPVGSALHDESLSSSHSASPRALSCQIPRA